MDGAHLNLLQAMAHFMESDKINTSPVSYLVYESSMARMERHAKRLTIALVLTIVLLFLSNVIWLYEWTRYDYTTTDSETTSTYTQDGLGTNIIGDSNNVTATSSEDENPNYIENSQK